MNTMRSTAIKEEGGVDNERIHPRVDQVPIVGLEEENEEVPLQEHQVPPKPQVSLMPRATFVERDMTNEELRDTLMNLTQLMTAKHHVVNNHFGSQANEGVGPQPNATTPAPRIRDFMRMNPLAFHGTKVDENPQGFID
ncbi:hypothetical protein EJD97_025668 [Solanum chilense]|uniref:Gag-pol polyprotein n=1 Tax=Solanum chilense TaxID=4083 RepID=A0A6N2ANX9_SOLCI|nr:hypothetical protein EJD97_025668 [Solanum chilense]